jgi:glyoxylase-like metal-dependent hydrolase (beta-lactamase superfamily II)
VKEELKLPMERIFENFYMITLPMPFRLKHVHVFALVHDGGVALFDTGVNSPETFLKLESSLKRIGRTVHDIDRIYVSHFHTDHCGIAGRIKEISGAVIHMSEVDAARIQKDQQGEMNVKLLKTFYRLHGLAEKSIEGLIRLLKFFQKATIPFEADRHLEMRENQTVGERIFEILPAPGHTRGQVCFFFRNEGILLSGDHVLPQITPNLSPDPYHPGFRPLHSFIGSLKKMKNLPVSRVYPAHGEPFTDLKGRIEEIVEHHRERKGLILDSVKRAPKTAFRVSQDIFGETLPEFDQFLAVNETYSHLVELQEEGLVRDEQKGDHLFYRFEVD